MDKILEIENLRVSYHTYAGEVQSVRGVSFDVEEGEAVAIVGESGCGKSVTAKSIMRLIKTPPGEIKDGSQILYKGKDVLKMDKKELSEYRGGEVAIIFQDALASLNPTMTVGKQIVENLMMHRKMTKAEAYKEAVNLLKMVGIPNAEGRVKQYPHEFSGGMRQRAMIAIAFACQPNLLIADEPTTALDVTIQAQIMDLLKELQLKEGKSIILITHNMGLVAEMADEVCVMYMGRVVEFGSLEDLFDRTSHPYTRALLRSVPVLGLADGQKLETIPGATPNPADLKGGCEFADRCSECMDRCREKTIPMFEIAPGHRVRCLKFDSYPEVD